MERKFVFVKMTDDEIDAYCDNLAKSGTEHGEQRAFFAWLAFHQDRYPLGKLAFAIPNGGLRDKVTAAKLKAEGVKPGVSDIFYPVQTSDYGGLFIEMKTEGGNVSPEQKAFIAAVSLQGYAVAVCWNWRAAKQCYIEYTERRTIGMEYT